MTSSGSDAGVPAGITAKLLLPFAGIAGLVTVASLACNLVSELGQKYSEVMYYLCVERGLHTGSQYDLGCVNDAMAAMRPYFIASYGAQAIVSLAVNLACVLSPVLLVVVYTAYRAGHPAGKGKGVS